jgi:hypothetical protein
MNYPALNQAIQAAATNVQYLGNAPAQAFYLDGYLSEVNFIDGQALAPTSFGEISPTTGQWVAKKYTGTYGANGFYLPFNDGTSTTTLTQDRSGNGNNWTATNISLTAGATYDWMLDVPLGRGGNERGNYCTLNPLDKACTVADGNLAASNGASSFLGVRSSVVAPSSGLFYGESTASIAGGSGNIVSFGLCSAVPSLASTLYAVAGAWVLYCGAAGNFHLSANGATTPISGAALGAGDVFQIALDCTNNRAWLGKNNVWYDSAGGTTGNPATGANPTITSLPAGLFVVNQVCGNTVYANFGQRPFAYTPPAGFKALHTGNLPTPAISKPSDHFNIALATGANIKTTTEALYPSNFFEWIKDRGNVNNHQLIDTVRGSSAVLQSNTTAAETTYVAPAGSSVGWAWKAGGAAVTNTAGSITSQVSANTQAGFSIVTFSKPAAAVYTVGHGLGVAPKLVLFKARTEGTVRWFVWHKSLPSANYFLYLNDTIGQQAGTGAWNDTEPTSSVFTTGSAFGAYNFVAYCFAEIPGYSKFGSYIGNGSADGPFVYCGFRPRYVLVKQSNGTQNWYVFDAARDSSNVSSLYLIPAASNAEASIAALDFTSSGFKIRDGVNAAWNGVGGTYIFAAFAEAPFKYALAR